MELLFLRLYLRQNAGLARLDVTLTTGVTIIVVLTAGYSDSVAIRHTTLTCATCAIVYIAICSILGHWIC